MYLRENIPTLAEGWMKWSNHVPLSYLWLVSILYRKMTVAPSPLPPHTHNLSQHNYKMLSHKELKSTAGISEKQLFVSGSVVREVADKTLGCRHTLEKKKPSYKLFLLDVKVISISGCNSGSGWCLTQCSYSIKDKNYLTQLIVIVGGSIMMESI